MRKNKKFKEDVDNLEDLENIADNLANNFSADSNKTSLVSSSKNRFSFKKLLVYSMIGVSLYSFGRVQEAHDRLVYSNFMRFKVASASMDGYVFKKGADEKFYDSIDGLFKDDKSKTMIGVRLRGDRTVFGPIRKDMVGFKIHEKFLFDLKKIYDSLIIEASGFIDESKKNPIYKNFSNTVEDFVNRTKGYFSEDSISLDSSKSSSNSVNEVNKR